ncbi:hypothetical protein [uncultured Acetatifactor sp.]|uniref:hypothetical protein n=1 Tax=uncultured Acetatifactor sp. TaxID=1671927 RepID=UPI0034DCE292
MNFPELISSPIIRKIEPYVFPQENSSRYDTDWVQVSMPGGQGLFFTSENRFSFNAQHYSAEAPTSAALLWQRSTN